MTEKYAKDKYFSEAKTDETYLDFIAFESYC